MDLNKLSEISIWDVRNVYNKVKNVVMNYTEMEIKVNEATGPEPWGASSTLMLEIAEGTFHPQSFGEIMPAIYLKFNDTDPSNWRQVYKALQLLEYLVKNGSERVVDDVRGHITIIKMLRNFHYVDESSKDQGINVRQRSKELLDLLQDSERIRDERKKAKVNRNKYQGMSGGQRYGGFGNSSGFGSEGSSMTGFGGGGGGGSSSSNNRYGGFGSDSYRPSSPLADAQNTSSNNSYRSSTHTPSHSGRSGARSRESNSRSKPALQKNTGPVIADLVSFDDDIETSSPINTGSVINPNLSSMLPPAATATLAPSLDDDWGDFQGSNSFDSTNNKPTPAVMPMVTKPKPNIQKSSNVGLDLLGGNDLLSDIKPLSQAPKSNSGNITPLQPMQPLTPSTLSQTGSTPNIGVKQMSSLRTASSPNSTSSPQQSTSGGSATPKSKSNDIWSANIDLVSLDSLSISGKKASGSNSDKKKMSMNQLASSGF